MKLDVRSIALYIMAISIALLAFLFIAIGAGYAAEPDRCADITIRPEYPRMERHHVDPGLSITYSGSYIWVQNTTNPPSSTQDTASIAMQNGDWRVCVGDTTWELNDRIAVTMTPIGGATSGTLAPSAATYQKDGSHPTTLTTSPRWRLVE